MQQKLLQASSLKTSILLPLVLTLIVLISGFVYSYIYQTTKYTHKHITSQFLSVKRTFNSSIKTETQKLSSLLTVITNNSDLKHAMMASDREDLLKKSSIFFNILHKKFGITHFYFHGTDRINFLRVHKPDRFGDKINRFSALQAEMTNRPSSALELGPLGLFTLRVVFPWYENEKLIGYVELGEEIEHVYENIKNVANVDIYVIINKENLSRKEWEVGMKMLERKGDWNLLPESVIVYNSLQKNDKFVVETIRQNGTHEETIKDIETENHLLKSYSLALTDPNKSYHKIGKIYFLYDITDIAKDDREHILVSVGLGITISTILIVFFLLLTRRIEHRLLSSKNGLIKSEAKFRSLVESSSDFIWEVDASGKYVYVSPKIKDLLGYEVDEILGKTPFDLMSKEEAKRISEKFILIAEKKQPFYSLENVDIHKNGQNVIIETSGIPIFDKNGILTGFRGIDRDVTERKNSQKALKKTTDRLLLHFNQSPLAMIEWNSDFKVIDWNPSAERIFGYTKSEAIGHTAVELILPQNVEKHVSQIWSELLSGIGGFRSTNENITKDGKLIICDWYNSSLVNEDGKIIGVTSMVEDITKQRHAQEKITHLAYFDALTELPNRILFKDRLEQACHIASRNQHIVAVLFMDIDHFKKINDSLGHIVGDLLLQEVSNRIKEGCRISDTVSRFGGDEFAVMIPKLENIKDMEYIIQSIIDRFNKPFTIMQHEIYVSFSMGFTYYPLDSENVEELLRNADTAMYYAKEQGREQYKRYHIDMTDNINMNLAMQMGLRKALLEEELTLYYQPQINIKTGAITGVEALIRWQHPEKGLISPDQFIPVAEESGLIVPIGEWIIRTACAQVKYWQEEDFTPIIMAINLSSRQFIEKGFAQSVIKIINEIGIDPKYVELEITESILVDNANSVKQALNEFKNKGISISLDDFGTGYSSLSYLKLFPIDKLKIDQSFVRDMLVDKSDASLIRAIISMAKALGLKTIAEGVETQEQLEFLQIENCEEVQGYLISRPVPPALLLDFLKK